MRRGSCLRGAVALTGADICVCVKQMQADKMTNEHPDMLCRSAGPRRSCSTSRSRLRLSFVTFQCGSVSSVTS